MAGRMPTMSVAGRFLDRLPVNAPYDGAVAFAYDTWLPPGTAFPDDGVHADIVRQAEGRALELGSGNGRFLLPLVEAGLALEGIDSSADMLDRCRQHATERGFDVVLHLGDIAPLALGKRYAALVCPAGSFTLLADEARAHAALASYLDHLEPGGRLAISMFTAPADAAPPFPWALRRTGTAEDGTTYVVHEATGADTTPQVQLVYNRVETYDEHGRLVDTLLRKARLRWWRQDQLSAAMVRAGFTDVESVGGESAWVTIARRP